MRKKKTATDPGRFPQTLRSARRMPLTLDTKQLLKTAAFGFEALSTTSHFADEVVEHYKQRSIESNDDVDLRIVATVENVLSEEESAIGTSRWWFDTDKFLDLVDDDDSASEVASIVLCMDDHDLGLGSALYELGERVSEKTVRRTMDELCRTARLTSLLRVGENR